MSDPRTITVEARCLDCDWTIDETFDHGYDGLAGRQPHLAANHASENDGHRTEGSIKTRFAFSYVSDPETEA